MALIIRTKPMPLLFADVDSCAIDFPKKVRDFDNPVMAERCHEGITIALKRLDVSFETVDALKETLHKSRRSCLVATDGVKSGYTAIV